MCHEDIIHSSRHDFAFDELYTVQSKPLKTYMWRHSRDWCRQWKYSNH